VLLPMELLALRASTGAIEHAVAIGSFALRDFRLLSHFVENKRRSWAAVWEVAAVYAH